MANKNQSRRNQSNRKQTRRKQSNRKQSNRKQSNRMKGGNSDFNVPIHVFYPQNTFENDMSRQMTTSVMKGGSKNHSRKYLKGGNGFFGNFGSLSGSSSAANQIAGSNSLNLNLGQSYKV